VDRGIVIEGRAVNMDRRILEERTKKFSINVIQLVNSFPKTKLSDVVGYQLLKAATSIGANYREATRAESKADFIHKIGIIEPEILYRHTLTRVTFLCFQLQNKLVSPLSTLKRYIVQTLRSTYFAYIFF
jgi:four helix bundle protein